MMSGPTLKKLRILLVDDNQENRIVLKAFAKANSWSFDEASDGAEALQLFANGSYDLILMDLQMPVMDGITAIHKIREIEVTTNLPPTPIIAMSAYAEAHEKEQGLDAGSNDVLMKPIQKASFLEMISKYTSVDVCHLDPDLEQLIPDFLGKRKIEILELQKAVDETNYAWIRETGHKLRGAAGSYGFTQLSETGKLFEEAAAKNDERQIRRTLTYYRHQLKQIQVKFD